VALQLPDIRTFLQCVARMDLSGSSFSFSFSIPLVLMIGAAPHANVISGPYVQCRESPDGGWGGSCRSCNKMSSAGPSFSAKAVDCVLVGFTTFHLFQLV
jgi:hypothetical protein